MCVLTHQLYNKYHNCEKTKLACVIHTHIHNVGYEECGEKHFSCPSQLAPGFLLDREMSLLSGLRAPRSPGSSSLVLLVGSPSPQSPLVPQLPIVPSGPLLPRTSSLFSAQEADLNGWHQRPPWPFGSLLSRPGGALGSLREGGQGNVAVSDSFPWGHLDLPGSLSSWKPLLSSWQLSPHKSSPFKSY